MPIMGNDAPNRHDDEYEAKRPPFHFNVFHYPTSCRVTTETAEAAAGVKQGSRGLRCDTSRAPGMFSFLLFNALLMAIYYTRLRLLWENDAPNPHDDDEYWARDADTSRVLVCFHFIFILSTNILQIAYDPQLHHPKMA